MRRGSCTQKSPFTTGKSAWAGRDVCGVRGKCNKWSAEGRTSKNCVHGLCCCPVHPSLSRVSPGAEGGWVPGSGLWRADPGRGQLLAVKRQPEGTGGRNSTTWKVFRRSLGHYRNKAPLLIGVQGMGPPLQPPSPPTGLLPPWALGGQPSEQAHPPLKSRPPPPMQALES